MKEITVLSGKGGAGKTTIAAALASAATNAVFCDNDVDASDLHLILNPEIKESHQFSSGIIATIHPETCINCGLCESSCRFTAIHKNDKNMPEVNPFQCEGCRLCERICPVNAISSQENLNNYWFVSDTRFGTLVHAKMGAGEENSGKLVTKVRERAKEIANNIKAEYILNDGPPGIGCTTIASITGTDAVLLVIEPTISGLHDAKRLVELVNTFAVPLFAVINKYDINEDFTQIVEDYLSKHNISLIGKIPFTKLMVESMINGKTVVEYAPDEDISKTFFEIWSALTKLTTKK
jgi:MinD superfamily P-loop ATPase